MIRLITCLSLVACSDPSFQDRIDELDAMVEVTCGSVLEPHDAPADVADRVRCMTDALAAGRVGKLTTEYEDFSFDLYGIERYYTIDGGITMLSLYFPPYDDPAESSEYRCIGVTTYEGGYRVSGVGCEEQ